ncbi:MAG: homocysteine S-methyltransferase family protein [Candidatus Eisenbacteria bacterium]|nr:homocysteine S-methyltransferase family protein [Candidatus Eisenbacteria bacterium]
MRALLERLEAGEVLVGDGATGTLLMAEGLEPGACSEAVNLERPELPEKIARLYAEAGADIVLTNTLGGSPLALARHGLEEKTEEIARAAVRAARRGAGEKVYVAASCGPTGLMLQPYGDADPDRISAAFERQIGALADAGIDLVVIETMTDLAEARLAVRAAKKVAPGIPTAATLTFDPTPKGFFTIMGQGIEQVCRGLEEAGADILGSNCGNGLLNMIRIARDFRHHTDRPLLIQSNAGLPVTEEDRLVYSESPAFFGEKTRDLLDAGVSIIGGCCGTTPDHVRAIRRAVDARASSPGA